MRHFQIAWHHIRRLPFQSLAAIIILFISFFTISSFIIFSFGLSKVLNYFETKPEITIFLKDGLDKEQIESLQRDIAAHPNIKEIKFISKEKALELYRQQNQNNPLLTEMVTASILPASFEVSVTDPKILKTLSDNVSSKTNLIEEVIYEHDIVDSLIRLASTIRQTGLIISVILVFISSLFTLIIIGMKITSHKDEIKVSRILGASRYYVERPFLIEGILYGLIGSILGNALSVSLIVYFQQQINSFFFPIVFVEDQLSFYLLLVTAISISGVFIGLTSSWLSVRRFIKF